MQLQPPHSSDPFTERYLVSRRLGGGGNGDAYLALDTSLRREVVLKRVKTDGENEAAVQEIMAEAGKLAALRHPNVVSVYDIFMSENSPCIVMEYIAGDNLQERVDRSGPLAIEDVAELARQTLEALVAAHAAGLVHRDIKPQNIMLSDLPYGSFQAKLLDFGMAKFIKEDAPSPQTVAIDGTVRGSIQFISPEQLSREPVDQRSDLYSLGCSLYFAVTGKYPFGGETVTEVIASHLGSKVVPAKVYRRQLGGALENWLMRLLKRHPAERFPNSLAALSALQDAALSDGVLKTTTAFIPSAAPVTKKSFPWVACASAAMLILAGTLAYFAIKPRTEKAVEQEQIAKIVAPSTPVKNPVIAEPVAAEPPAITPAAPSPRKVAELKTPDPDPVPQHEPAVVTAPPAKIVYEVAGSNTIGAALMPALIKAYLERLGAVELKMENPVHEETLFSFLLPGSKDRESVLIRAHGSSTSFQALEGDKTQLGMSSRPIKTEEVQRLAPLGDMLSRACEHVVGLDGLAVIVNQSNPISALSVAQVASIFSGEITDWAQIGGTAGPISIYARDDKSGTYDSFKSMILIDKKLRGDSKRFEDSNALSDDVAADPKGIGFIGLPYVRNSKALALSDAGTLPMMPSPFTVATEDYVLSRRLFLYSPAVPSHPWTLSFVEFALSDEGQKIVEKVGFIPQTIEIEQIPVRDDMPAKFREFLSDSSSQRLSLTFRFRRNEALLDAKAVRDLDRVVRFLARPENRRKQIYLLGFSDSIGSRSANLQLSEDRAQSVAREFTLRGISPAAIIAMGSVMPVATNDTKDGQQKNRRVEVWVR